VVGSRGVGDEHSPQPPGDEGCHHGGDDLIVLTAGPERRPNVPLPQENISPSPAAKRQRGLSSDPGKSAGEVERGGDERVGVRTGEGERVGLGRSNSDHLGRHPRTAGKQAGREMRRRKMQHLKWRQALPVHNLEHLRIQLIN
jgi:hypothetical protein